MDGKKWQMSKWKSRTEMGWLKWRREGTASYDRLPRSADAVTYGVTVIQVGIV